MNDLPETVLEDVRRALENDQQFQFKRAGDNLRLGICPNCGERECFVNLQKPWRVKCGRLNNCKWTATTRELYPEIFENLSHRHPATESEPNATADAYMSQLRGFDLSKIKGMYFQANAKNAKRDEYYPAVKVIISQTCYWLRIIDADDVRRNGAKSKIVGDFQGFGWVPPGMTFEQNDEIWITEGIFKSMALLHIGVKSISGLSASNLPRDIIKANAGKKITWVIAEDADKAGHDAAVKFREEIQKLGEQARVAFPENGEDWDDVFRDGRLTSEYLKESYWRGFYALADSPHRRAFYHYCRFRSNHHVFDFSFMLWRYKIDDKAINHDENKFTYPHPDHGWNLTQVEIDSAFAKFTSFAEIRDICPCKPQFLYMEEDILTKERTNCFYVEFANHTPSMLLTAPGTIYSNPAAFSDGLLKATGFVPFTGTAADLAILHKKWFRHRIKFVRSVPFVGYDANSRIYAFPNFSYQSGQLQKVNEYGFVNFGQVSLKCTYKSDKIIFCKQPDEFTGDWIGDYYDAFSLNGMVLLSWWLGTLFAEQIRAAQQSWPFLEYTGERGSGKSTQLAFLWHCCGMTGHEGLDPHEAKTTSTGLFRDMSQFSNLPLVLLEADRDPNAPKKDRRDFDFNCLKDMFNANAAIRTIGVKTGGNETRSLIFRGGILISQNAEVKASPAVLSRIVHCHCTPQHFTPENARQAKRLIKMTAQQLGGFLHAVLHRERQLLDGYYRAYEKVMADFEDRNQSEEVKEYRLRHCHAQVAAWALQLPTLFGCKLSPAQIKATVDHIWERAKSRQRRLGSDHPLLEQFWEIYEYLHEQTGPYNSTVEILNHSNDPALIAINIPHFQEIAANHRQTLPPTSDLTTLFKSGQRHPCRGFKVVRSAIRDKPIGCWIFDKNRRGNGND